jgi:NADPH2:quinone reductase
MPFILRGVSLLGINSSGAPYPLRQVLWEHLATDWRPPHLTDILTARVGIEALTEVFDRMLTGRTHGRVLVEIGEG